MTHTFSTFPQPIDGTTIGAAVGGQVWVEGSTLFVSSDLDESQVWAAIEASHASCVAAEEAKAAAKASALAKLEALGLTADEASALLGV
jgi:hypothetical protein